MRCKLSENINNGDLYRKEQFTMMKAIYINIHNYLNFLNLNFVLILLKSYFHK